MHYRNEFFKSVLRPILRKNKVLFPSLSELSSFSVQSEIDPLKLFSAFNNKSLDKAELVQEYLEMEKILISRIKQSKQNFPLTHNISSNSALFLYLMTRSIRPKTILETGVANGISSYYILSALLMNGSGTLHSVDISRNVGNIISSKEKANWNLHVISEENSRRDFINILRDIGSVDFFIHDSDHAYDGQMFEYESVYPVISNYGVFSSDDVDFSYAFIDFCSKKGLKPSFLVSTDKVFGIAIKKSS